MNLTQQQHEPSDLPVSGLHVHPLDDLASLATSPHKSFRKGKRPMLSIYPSPSVTASPKSSPIPLTPYSSHISPSSPIPHSPILSYLDPPSANVSFQYSRPISIHLSPVQDILFPGDIIGQSLNFHVERVRLLPISASHHNGDDDLNVPSIKFELVKALGTGSYAVVYQVRQILSR